MSHAGARARSIPAGIGGGLGDNAAMRIMTLLRPTLAGAAVGCAALSRAETAAPAEPSPIEVLAARLPPDVGDAAREWLHEDSKDLKAAKAFSPADLEQQVMVDLASEPEAAGFILAKMASEPAKTDFMILKVVDFDRFWPETPGIIEGLQKLAETAKDPDLMLAYMDSARRMEVKHLRKLLTARIADARRAGD